MSETTLTETYRDWTITIAPATAHCSNYRFVVTAPTGYRQEVKLGGETSQRALERARELVDLELALEAENDD